jgi:hypothetical protein
VTLADEFKVTYGISQWMIATVFRRKDEGLLRRARAC